MQLAASLWMPILLHNQMGGLLLFTPSESFLHVTLAEQALRTSLQPLSQTPSNESWTGLLELNTPGSNSSGAAVVGLNAPDGDDAVVACCLGSRHQELQFADLQGGHPNTSASAAAALAVITSNSSLRTCRAYSDG